MTVAEDLRVDVGEFPYELTSEELAHACRRAYLRIIVGAHVGWGKVELARWLAGPYRRLTQLRDASSVSDAALGLRSSSPPVSGVTPVPPSAAGVSETRVGELLEQMRVDVLLVLRELTTAAGRAAFTTLAADTELVALAADAGESIIVPRAHERMSLVDRVLSLVAVDAMTRSEDFEHSLFVCSRCDQPVFDVHSRPQGVCRIHVSGVTRA